jgi:hypothetical protein
LAEMHAPRSAKARTIAVLPFLQAQCIGVRLPPALAEMYAPRSTKARMVAVWSFSQAQCSGVLKRFNDNEHSLLHDGSSQRNDFADVRHNVNFRNMEAARSHCDVSWCVRVIAEHWSRCPTYRMPASGVAALALVACEREGRKIDEMCGYIGSLRFQRECSARSPHE